MIKVLCILLGLACGAAPAEWPQWRGPNRDGICSETGLLKSWPPGGPKQAWKVTGLGEGYSAFSIVAGRLFTQGQRGDRQYVLALDANTGKKLWETPTGSSFRERRGHGPRGTPTVDGNRLWALAADGSLVCLDTATGKQFWRLNLMDKFRARVPTWGISESPLIDGDRVIVTPGGPGAAVVALDKSTGELVWKSQSDAAAYSSPIVFEFGGIRQIVAFTAQAALGLSAKNGELLWRYDKVANHTANIATPVFHDGHIFVSSDYGTGCALLRLNPRGASEVYFSRDMQNHYSTSVLVGDYLYGYSNAILTAMDFKTGRVAWRDRSVGKGSVLYADGHLYCLGEDGVMGLVEATPQAYREKSRFQIPRGDFPTWTPPVISGGKLYLRDQDNLYCFNLK